MIQTATRKAPLTAACAWLLAILSPAAGQDLGPKFGRMAKQRKSLDEIKKELKLEGTDDWAGKDRLPNNIEAAYRAVTQR